MYFICVDGKKQVQISMEDLIQLLLPHVAHMIPEYAKDHNALGNKQGGRTGEYNHLNNYQAVCCTRIATPVNSGLMGSDHVKRIEALEARLKELESK